MRRRATRCTVTADGVYMGEYDSVSSACEACMRLLSMGATSASVSDLDGNVIEELPPRPCGGAVSVHTAVYPEFQGERRTAEWTCTEAEGLRLACDRGRELCAFVMIFDGKVYTGNGRRLQRCKSLDGKIFP